MGYYLQTCWFHCISQSCFSNSTFIRCKGSIFFSKTNFYQIKFCSFVPGRQKNTNMNRIKEVLETKALVKQNWQISLERLSTWSIYMLQIKCSLPFPYCIRLQTFLMLTFENFSYPINLNKSKTVNYEGT